MMKVFRSKDRRMPIWTKIIITKSEAQNWLRLFSFSFLSVFSLFALFKILNIFVLIQRTSQVSSIQLTSLQTNFLQFGYLPVFFLFSRPINRMCFLILALQLNPWQQRNNLCKKIQLPQKRDQMYEKRDSSSLILFHTSVIAFLEH